MTEVQPQERLGILRRLFCQRHTAGELEQKIAAVDARVDGIEAQLKRMAEVFDTWSEVHRQGGQDNDHA